MASLSGPIMKDKPLIRFTKKDIITNLYAKPVLDIY